MSAIGADSPIRVHVPARSARGELRAISIVWRRELIRFRSDRLRLVTTLVQPLLFLFVLGSGLQQLSSASTHGPRRAADSFQVRAIGIQLAGARGEIVREQNEALRVQRTSHVDLLDC